MGEGFDNMFALSLQKSNEESFPVLKAFQEFLESERERARRRQLTLTLAFMGVIVALVVVFCVIGIVMFNGLVNQNAQQQGKMLELLMQRSQSAPEVRVVEAAPPPAAAAPDPVLEGLMETLKELRSEIASRREADEKRAEAIAQANAAAAEEAAKARESEADAKRTGIFSKIKPREELRRQAAPERPEPAPEAAPANVPAAPVAAPAASDSRAPAGVPDGRPARIQVKPVREMRVPEGYKTDSMSIVTEGRQRVPWRIVMPAGGGVEGAADGK